MRIEGVIVTVHVSHRLATSFGTTCGVACASCKWLPLRQVNTDNI